MKKPTHACLIIFCDRTHRILLGEKPDGTICLPGKKLDKREASLEAALIGTAQATTLIFLPAKMTQSGQVAEAENNKENVRHITDLFLLHADSANLEVHPTMSMKNHAWYDLRSLPKEMSPSIRRGIQLALSHCDYHESKSAQTNHSIRISGEHKIPEQFVLSMVMSSENELLTSTLKG